MTAACCVYECVGKAVIKDLMEREIILHLLCGSVAISCMFPPFLAIGSPHQRQPRQNPFGEERIWGQSGELETFLAALPV